MLYVASPAPDGRSYFTEIETGGIHRTYKCDPMPNPSSVTFSPANNTLIVPQNKTAIFMYSLGSQQPIQKCFTSEKIASTCVSPCGKYAIGGGNETGTIFTWLIATGELLCITKAHMKTITSMSFNCDGSLLATSSLDSTVKVWRFGSLLKPEATPVSTFSSHTLGATCCQFFKYASYVATVSKDRSCRVFDALTGTEMLSVPIETAGASVCIAKSDTLLMCGGENGVLHFIDINTAIGPVVVKVASFADGHSKAVNYIEQLPDRRILTSSVDGQVLLWDASNEKPQLLREVAHVKHGICTACIAPHITMHKLQRGDVPQPTAQQCPVLSKYPVNTIVGQTHFNLPATQELTMIMEEIAAAEKVDPNAEEEAEVPAAEEQKEEAVVDEQPEDVKVAAKASALRKELTTAKYNKKKQKRLRDEVEAVEQAAKAKKFEEQQQREKTNAAIAEAEAKCAELTAMATKMAKALKKGKGSGSTPNAKKGSK